VEPNSLEGMFPRMPLKGFPAECRDVNVECLAKEGLEDRVECSANEAELEGVIL